MNRTIIIPILFLVSAFTTPVLAAEKMAQKDRKAQTKTTNPETEFLINRTGCIETQVPDEYNFDHRFVILIETFSKKGKASDPMEMTMLTKEDSPQMGMVVSQEGVTTEMVYDMEKNSVVTLMDMGDQKMGTSMSLNSKQIERIMAENSKTESGSGKMPIFKKTGNTKTISGFNCDEYIVENLEDADGSTVAYWISDELEADWIRSMSSISGMNKQMPELYSEMGYPEDGSVVQMVVVQKNGERMVMTVKKAEVNQDITISTKGYKFMNIGGR